MFCGAQKHSKDWKAASKWKLCDVRGIRATGAGLSIAREKVLRSRRGCAMRRASRPSGA